MKRVSVKHIAFLFCCSIYASLTSCASHSFHSKKHQHRHFFGEKEKQKSKSSVASLQANTSTEHTQNASLKMGDVEIN